jgi:poly(3-hydroxybutyrate) depolymerase
MLRSLRPGARWMTCLRRAMLCMVEIGVAMALVASTAVAAEAAADARLATGSGVFDYTFVSAQTPRKVTVWYHRPAEAGADAAIVFVLHGQNRTASNYRKYWIPFAERQRFVLLVPEFSRSQFPGNRGYNFGNMVGPDGKQHPERQWTYSAIEALFDDVRAANGFVRKTYDIYGHSAGGQFVHRLVLFKPHARFRVAVAANSGWYTMPDRSVRFPYGLGGSSVGPEQIARALSRRLVVLLGDADNDPGHPDLNRTLGALEQGPHRLARGQAFFDSAQRAAAQLQVPLAWTLETAPGAAHSNAAMAPFAARWVGIREDAVAGSARQ